MTFIKALIHSLIGGMVALVLLFGVWPALGASLSDTDEATRTVATSLGDQSFGPPVEKQAWRPGRSNLSTFGEDDVIVVPASAFVSDGFMPDSFFFPFGGGYLQGDANNYGCVEAPVYFPAGTTVVEMHASVYDNDPVRGISLALRRVDNFASGTDTLASLSTTGIAMTNTVQVLSTDALIQSLVTHPDYAYYVTTCLESSNIRIYSVWFDLPSSVHMPVIRKPLP